MPATAYRAILDTNIVVRGFINLQSASGRILGACQRRQVLPELAIAASATHLITTDQDMLALVGGRDDVSKRFRRRTATRVRRPEDFIAEYPDAVAQPA